MVPGQPQFLEIDVTPLETFHSSHPKITSQTQEFLWLEWVLFSLISHSTESFTAFTPYCVQQIHEYHREAALPCMRGPANIGLALPRMACELSRDVLRLARDKQVEASWSSRKTDFRKYKDLFKFRKDSPAERMLFDVYKMSSSFGVHGHILFTEPIRVVQHVGRDFVRLRPEEYFTLTCLSLNIVAIHAFIMAFLLEHGQVFLNAEDPVINEDARKLSRDVCAVSIDWKFRHR